MAPPYECTTFSVAGLYNLLDRKDEPYYALDWEIEKKEGSFWWSDDYIIVRKTHIEEGVGSDVLRITKTNYFDVNRPPSFTVEVGEPMVVCEAGFGCSEQTLCETRTYWKNITMVLVLSGKASICDSDPVTNQYQNWAYRAVVDLFREL